MTNMDGARGCGDSADVMMTSRIDRTSSIENEPRTLHFNQMEYARVCLYVCYDEKQVFDDCT